MSRHAATRTVALAVAVVLAGLGTSILAGAPGAGAAVRSAHRTTGASQVGVVSNYTDPSINGPTGITVGPDGALWFTNLHGASIGRITPNGTVSAVTDPSISFPSGITSGPDGGLWFTSDGYNTIGRITP